MFKQILEMFFLFYLFILKQKTRLERLRDLNLKEKNEMNSIRKQNDELTGKLKSMTRENETLKAENVASMAQINELNDQV